MWEPVKTPNNFDILKLTDPPEGQPPKQPESEDDNLEIQKENIKLQHQVQYLQRRIAQSGTLNNSREVNKLTILSMKVLVIKVNNKVLLSLET